MRIQDLRQFSHESFNLYLSNSFLFHLSLLVFNMDKCDDDIYDVETKEAFKARLTNFLNKMMFVSGETAEVAPETTSMIEEIVRQQVIFMVSRPSRTVTLDLSKSHI